MPQFKILHIITGLHTGGAEMMLYKLLSYTDRERFSPAVISLIQTEGQIKEKIKRLGIPVYQLGMKAGKPTLSSVYRLVQLCKELNPDLIQGWMYHGNIAAQFAKYILKNKVPLIWNIRHSLYKLSNEKQLTSLIIRLGAKISYAPQHIMYNSHLSAQQHEQIGYRSSKTIVIPNGFDINLFQPSMNARQELRKELRVSESTILISLIARYHPMKDHKNFLTAAAALIEKAENVHFVLVGRGINWDNSDLKECISSLDIYDKIHLLGERGDISYIQAGVDIASLSSSYGEGFPNVLGEAMACGVPCVATDIGDSAYLIGDTGSVVPPNRPDSLAEEWYRLIEAGVEGRGVLGRRARQRICDHFSIQSVVEQYEGLYINLLQDVHM